MLHGDIAGEIPERSLDPHPDQSLPEEHMERGVQEELQCGVLIPLILIDQKNRVIKEKRAVRPEGNALKRKRTKSVNRLIKVRKMKDKTPSRLRDDLTRYIFGFFPAFRLLLHKTSCPEACKRELPAYRAMPFAFR